MKKIIVKENVTDYVFMLLGILSISFALKSLLMPNKFFDGGVTGIALLLYKKYPINIALIFILLNIPFLLLGKKLINKSFAVKSIIGVIILGICLYFIPFPEVSHDKLIVSVFGGFFIGLGVGFGMKAGIALDGIEVLAVYTGKKVGFSMSEIILGINILIFLIAGVFFGLESAFYSMLTYFVASKTIDYVVEGFEEFTGVTIISSKSEEIKEFLVLQMGKGITIYKGERGFMKESFNHSVETDIVYTVVTRLEVRKLKNSIQLIDEKAFIFSSSVKETAGGILKKKNSH